MARISYIPHDAAREEEIAEIKADRKAMRTMDLDTAPPSATLVLFEGLDPNDDEFASSEALAEFLMDSDRETFDHRELRCLHYRTEKPLTILKTEMAAWGLSLAIREREQIVRGFNANPHNRWEGNPMCGGGGGNAIIGMAD